MNIRKTFVGIRFKSMCIAATLLIAPETEEYEEGKFGYKNICIKNNKFILSDNSPLYARSADNAVFTDNEIICGFERDLKQSIAEKL